MNIKTIQNYDTDKMVIDGTRLESVNKDLIECDVPFGVTEIGYRAFEACLQLERVSIPEGVKTIAAGAFFCLLFPALLL